jgi:ABC-type lipoprotein release transport system permease subunit
VSHARSILIIAINPSQTPAVISYLAVERTHEIGVRVALGARRSEVLLLVLNQGVSMALPGIGIGMLLALGPTR